MRRCAILLFCFPVAGLEGATIAADSERGARLFETLSCIQCHTLNGRGGGSGGPDLGRRIDRNFTPASLAATMWNHAPVMWGAMKSRGLPQGNLDNEAAGDLFAFFYAARFFEKPGDAARGKKVYFEKRCAECHGHAGPKMAEAKPVAEWQGIGDPVALVGDMWNHATTMRQAFARKNLGWPSLSGPNVADMLVYLRNLPALKEAQANFRISPGAQGEALFQSKGCGGCHTGALALPPRLKGKTLTDIAADLWNHEPKMTATPARIEPDEMREILSSLWAQQFFADSGSAQAGAAVFRAKRCSGCHEDAASGAPKLTGSGRSFTSTQMVSALWRHGPTMLDRMRQTGVAWPRFRSQEMSNLIAYLNSAKGGR